MKILIVDDDIHQLYSYGAMVRNLGHEVTLVDSAFDAEFEIEEESFDALITDMSMPGKTGYDLIYWIWAMKHDLPCLVHSMEDRHSTGHEWIDLNVLHKKFPFVTFKKKQIDSHKIEAYITEFLSSIQTT